MKFLCICAAGMTRSVAMANVLKCAGQEAIAIGATNSSLETIGVLSVWADHIIVMEPQYAIVIPEQYKSKVKVVNVGPDKWNNPCHPDLINTIRNNLHEIRDIKVEDKPGT